MSAYKRLHVNFQPLCFPRFRKTVVKTGKNQKARPEPVRFSFHRQPIRRPLLWQGANILLCSSLFRRVRKISKSDYYLHDVCLFVRMEQLGYHWKDFHKIWCFRIFKKSVEKIYVYEIASDAKHKRTALFWTITQFVVVIFTYRRFGAMYRCRNVGKELPLHAA